MSTRTNDKPSSSGATGATPQHGGGRVRLSPVLGIALLLLAPASAAWQLDGSRGLGIAGAAYAFVSALTYVLYARDKQYARRNEWLIHESTLHLLGLIGGWPGAFLAQRRLRHKSAKTSFQLVFWCIVAVHQYLAIDVLMQGPLSESASGEIQRWSQR